MGEIRVFLEHVLGQLSTLEKALAGGLIDRAFLFSFIRQSLRVAIDYLKTLEQH
jgi:hypothetical protein